MNQHLFKYWGFGCQILSDKPLLSLARDEGPECQRAIRLNFSSCPQPLPVTWFHDGDFYRYTDKEFFYHVPQLGTFRYDGTIWIDVHGSRSEANQYLVEAHLFGPVLAAALQRMNFLTLHANSLRLNDKTCLLCGWPGSGKSTLAYALIIRGAKSLGDDHCAIFPTANGLTCSGGLTHIKLMPDSLEHFQLPIGGTDALEEHIGKRVQRLAARSVGMQGEDQLMPTTVNDIIILERATDKQPALVPVSGNNKFTLLKGQLFRAQFLSSQDSQASAVHSLMTLAKQARVWRLLMPFGLHHVDDAADIIVTRLANLEAKEIA